MFFSGRECPLRDARHQPRTAARPPVEAAERTTAARGHSLLLEVPTRGYRCTVALSAACAVYDDAPLCRHWRHHRMAWQPRAPSLALDPSLPLPLCKMDIINLRISPFDVSLRVDHLVPCVCACQGNLPESYLCYSNYSNLSAH
jgi:hypothetical protein